MASLGKVYKVGPPRQVDPPEVQLANAMEQHGIPAPDHIHLDGVRYRYGKEKEFWYRVYGDGVPAGCFGNWKLHDGGGVRFKADIGRELTATEQMQSTARVQQIQKERAEELEQTRKAASNEVVDIWEGSREAGEDFPYLAKKGVKANGARLHLDGRLILPLYGEDGTLASLQYISPDGKKLYHKGGAVGGKFNTLGIPIDGQRIYIAEGFATSATIHEETGAPCVVGYSASNLVPVSETIRKNYPTSELVIVADNDESGTGKNYADQASAKTGAKVIMPPEKGDANDYKQAGGDLKGLLEPEKSDWFTGINSFCSKPAPISWLVKHWLPKYSLGMVHGQSGSGKTFVVLDLCLRLAAGLDEWAGNKVRPGKVAYLAGEGHHGLRGRVAAWQQTNGGLSDENMVVSSSGCDLNTPEGYAKVSTSLADSGMSPDLIVVDTLHRFLDGDENSSVDAKTMLDACASLMNQFGCAVLLVHHTGVDDSSQHRYRGSSAWRGALDFEISVIAGKEDHPIEVKQRKMKDAEEAGSIFVSLKSVPITGWKDEDGDQVTSAIVEPADPPVVHEKVNDKLAQFNKLFERGWGHSGMELDGQDRPYVSRSAMLRFLILAHGISENSAKQYLKPGAVDKFIGYLLNAEIIVSESHGWAVTDPALSSALKMQKSWDEGCGPNIHKL